MSGAYNEQTDRYYDELARNQVESNSSAPARNNIEITIKTRPSLKGKEKEKDLEASNRRKAQLALRLVKIDCHKIHTVLLLANLRIRNRWINDELLHARLLSLTPLHLQTAFTQIHKSRVPDVTKRGRLFEAAVNNLVDWWANDFFTITSAGLRARSFSEIQKIVSQVDPSLNPEWSETLTMDELEELDPKAANEDWIRSPKSLSKHALMRQGSRDTSAQLFTALCRALGVPARLVGRVEGVAWWSEKVSSNKKKGKSLDKSNKKDAVEGEMQDGEAEGSVNVAEDDDDEDMDMEEVDIPSVHASSPVPSTSSLPPSSPVPSISSTPVPSSSRAKGKGKAKAVESFPGAGQSLNGSNPNASSASAKGNGKEKAKPVIKLRKQKQKGRTLRETKVVDPMSTPPTLWVEVFSRPDGRWIPVDPFRAIVNRKNAFDPEGKGGRLVYVVGVEEDGYARDVTRRYAKDYTIKVLKLRAAGSTDKDNTWWDGVMNQVTRPYRLHRDDVEDSELALYIAREPLPTSLGAFKNHPSFALERHLKQTEIIHPKEGAELGKFRGEPVYPRSNVIAVKSAESWMRLGRKVRESEVAVKRVKLRAATVGRKREVEMRREVMGLGGEKTKGKGKAMDVDEDDAEEMGEEGMEIVVEDGIRDRGREWEDEALTTGLYAEFQTELYKPTPVIDGKVPKNNFGNIDLYVPSMCPDGGVHVPFKGAAKIARQLGFDYADAVTGFEFRKGKATPVISGIVIASENEETLLEAYWESERNSKERRKAKEHDMVVKRWIRLIQGLRIRERLQKQYKGKDKDCGPIATGVGTGTPDGDPVGQEEGGGFLEPGGYLMAVDDIVQPYTLPKYQHVVAASLALSAAKVSALEPSKANEIETAIALSLTIEGDEEEDDVEMEEVIPATSGLPKTMRELAEDAARVNRVASDHGEDKEEYAQPPSPVQANDTLKRNTRPTSSTKLDIDENDMTKVTRGATRRKRDRADPVPEDPESGPGSPSPSKRGRRAAYHSLAQSAVKSDRVLRSRKQKPPAELEAEREAERAYRRAVEE